MNQLFTHLLSSIGSDNNNLVRRDVVANDPITAQLVLDSFDTLSR